MKLSLNLALCKKCLKCRMYKKGGHAKRTFLFHVSVLLHQCSVCYTHSPEASASTSAPSAPPPTANVANCCPLLPQITAPQHQVQKKHVLLRPGVILFPAQTITCSCLHTNMIAHLHLLRVLSCIKRDYKPEEEFAVR